MRKFRTAYSIILMILMSLCFLSILVASLIEKEWIVFLLLLAFTIFFFYGIIQTFYIVNAEQATLKVTAGPLFNTVIDINTIKRVEESNSLLSAPAMSMKRLEIIYNKFDSLLVSPKDKEGFVAALQEVNPEIVYKRSERQVIVKK